MAHKVFISSSMSVDERLIEIAEQDPVAALMWPWLLTAFDDWGRAEANAKKLKAVIFPAVPIVSHEEVERALCLYEAVGLLRLYEVDGRRYMAIPPQKWYKYQTHMNRKDRRAGKDKLASDFPAPPDSPCIPVGNCGDVRGVHDSPRSPIPSPSPSPSPEINIILHSRASPCGDARVCSGQPPAFSCPVDDVEAEKVTVQPDWDTYSGRAAGQDPDMSVEAEKVTAMSGEQRAKTPLDSEEAGEKPNKPRPPFTSKKQESLFDRFWEAYPRRKNKGQAEKAWQKIRPDEELFRAIMAGLERARASYDWRKEGGRYIPYPATWLNAKGWEDEYAEGPGPPGCGMRVPRAFASLMELAGEEEATGHDA